MYLSLVFLSFIGACLAGLFGRQLGSCGAAIIATSCLFLSLFFSLFAFYEIALLGGFVYIKLATWINSEVLNVDWGFMFDSLTVTMCVVVTFISSFVHLYSTEYMSHDPHLARFMCYLSLFTFFMLILVTSDNFVQIFLGWEGICLASYLLINFWFTRIQANKASLKAMILNRIGDFFLVMAALLVFIHFKAAYYGTLAVFAMFFKNESINFLNLDLSLLNIVGTLLFLGAVCKSVKLLQHACLYIFILHQKQSLFLAQFLMYVVMYSTLTVDYTLCMQDTDPSDLSDLVESIEFKVSSVRGGAIVMNHGLANQLQSAMDLKTSVDELATTIECLKNSLANREGGDINITKARDLMNKISIEIDKNQTKLNAVSEYHDGYASFLVKTESEVCAQVREMKEIIQEQHKEIVTADIKSTLALVLVSSLVFLFGVGKMM